jgi:hypothetical protein
MSDGTIDFIRLTPVEGKADGRATPLLPVMQAMAEL